MAARGPVILVAGPPASGKGTQCKRLAKKYGLLHISIGDFVRAESQRDTELGRQVNEYMSKGDFVPDELTWSIVKEQLGNPEAVRQGVLLDGFPRTGLQAELLVAGAKDADISVDKCLMLQVPDEIVVKRALGRRNDPVTGEIYHLDFVPPPPEVASRLEQRQNDTSEEIVKKRLEVYHAQLESIRKILENCLVDVDGTVSVEQVFEAFCNHVGKLFPGEPVADEDDWGDEEEEQKPDMLLNVEVIPCEDVGSAAAECPVMVSIQVPQAPEIPIVPGGGDGEPPPLQRTTSGRVKRAPADVCCVVDISGSMGQKATYEVDGQMKDDGLNYLDIVKHAVKAVMGVLKDQDRFALIAYDHNARTVFALQPMTASGRDEATKLLEELRPSGGTSIWGGVLAGMDALRTPEHDVGFRQKTLLLLTDGAEGRAPPRGHLTELKDYKEKHPGFNFQLNSFGFGYNLDSSLLLNLANEGNGTFAFIPDALIVGTCFVNSVANLLSTQTQNATLHLSVKGGAEFKGPVIGIQEDSVSEASWGRVVNLGPLTFGQSRNVVFPLQVPPGSEPFLEATLVYQDFRGKECRASAVGTSRASTPEAIAARARAETVSKGFLAIAEGDTGHAPEAREKVLELGAVVEAYEAASKQYDTVTALKADVQGRMAKSLDGNDRYKRWGRHYLRGLLRAHQLQLTTNFMDTGLQPYGGLLFRSLREEGDRIFVTLPPPKPSATPTRTATTTSSATRAKSPDMNTYYAGSGGG